MSELRIAFIVIAASALLLAVALSFAVVRLRTRIAVPGTHARHGAIVSSDTGVAPPIMVRDPVLGIRGTPDYVLQFEVDGQWRLAPMELKPTRRSRHLFDRDRLQLGAYLLGLRGTVGEKALPIGFVRYQYASFEIPLTPELESRVAETVAAIRRDRTAAILHRSHRSVARCRGCAVRAICDESLAD